MDTTCVEVEVSDFVAPVTMNRPPVNAISPELLEGLTQAFDAFTDRDDVRAAVLTGAGKIFCAGADIKNRATRATGPGDGWQHSRRSRETFNAILESQVPVIAALNGPALGAGLAIAASCDILISSERGVLGLPEINVGLLGGGRHAMRLFGHSKARMLMFAGQRIDGPELYRLGVVEACVPHDELMPAALDLARDIASKSPIAMRLAKHAMNAIEHSTLRDGYRFEQGMTAELGKYEDSKEAMRAFAEKRDPMFKGR